MKALMVGMEWLPNRAGGLNRYFYDMVHAMPAVGVGGRALVSFAEPGQQAPLDLQAMATRGAGLPQLLHGARRAVRRALQEEDIDIINPHFALHCWPWLRDVPRNMPLVVNFHGPWADEIAVEASKRFRSARVLLARRIERQVYQRADRIVTLSAAFRDLVVERYGVPETRVRIVPGGIHPAPFLAAPDRRAARERLGWPQDRPILLSVRRLTRRMGLENLIDAFAQVRRQHPDAMLFLGGRGHLAAALQKRIAEANLTDCAQLLGFVSDENLPLAYAAADITVVPTIALEGFGLITLESLASGTPVLGTPVGGTPEILQGLHSCMIFESAAPAAIADRIDSALAGRLVLPDREACRAYANRYAWTEIAPQLRSVFAEPPAIA